MGSWKDRSRHAAIALSAVAALGTAVAPPALAKTPGCTGESLHHPFAAFGDNASYFLIPNGGFVNGGSGWQFTGGASVVTKWVHRHGKTAVSHATKTVGRVPKLESWSPTRKISLSQGLLKLGRGATWIRYQFTAPKSATWLIDDVFVDPHMKF